MLDLFRQLAAAIDAPELICPMCRGRGTLDSGVDCRTCDGFGNPEPPEYEPEEE